MVDRLTEASKLRNKFLRQYPPELNAYPDTFAAAINSNPYTSTGISNGEYSSLPDPVSKGGGLLAAGLAGAAYGIQANVGNAVPGQSFRQGILKGIVGAGIVGAGISAREQTELQKAKALEDKRTEFTMKYDIKHAGEPSWAEKEATKQANRLALLKEQSVSKEDVAKINAGMSEKELADFNLEVKKEVKKRFPWRNPTPLEEYNVAIDIKQAGLSGRALPKKPLEVVPPMPAE